MKANPQVIRSQIAIFDSAHKNYERSIAALQKAHQELQQLCSRLLPHIVNENLEEKVNELLGFVQGRGRETMVALNAAWITAKANNNAAAGALADAGKPLAQFVEAEAAGLQAEALAVVAARREELVKVLFPRMVFERAEAEALARQCNKLEHMEQGATRWRVPATPCGKARALMSLYDQLAAVTK